MEAHVTIIVVSYNSYEIAERGLAGIFASERYPSIVVDNASADGSAQRFRARFPGATVIGLDKNIGYGRAANIGLRLVETPYALLLNPDIEVTEAAVESLLAVARDDASHVSIWAPAVRREEYSENASPECVLWVSGCAMLFRAGLIRDVGLFDENIFLTSIP
jgi:GT2 family glycosyltransferase